MLLEQELVANLVGILRGQMHADSVAGLEPVAGEAEVGPLGDLEAEHVLVEFLGALEVLRDQQEMVQFGDRHEVSSVGMRYFACEAAAHEAAIDLVRSRGAAGSALELG